MALFSTNITVALKFQFFGLLLIIDIQLFTLPIAIVAAALLLHVC